MTKWTQAEAIELCRKIEAVIPKFGYHPALTGGCLYKDGDRKDCDIVFYRHRQFKGEYDFVGAAVALYDAIGMEHTRDLGRCKKFVYGGKPVDVFLIDDDTSSSEEYPE